MLKGEDSSITESLTKVRMEKLKEARETYVFKKVWTSDDKLFFKDTFQKILQASPLPTVTNYDK